MSHSLNTATTLLSVGGVVVLSAWGGTVRFLQGVRAGEFPFTRFCFFTEISTSAFVGVVTYVLCEAFSVDHYLTAAAVAVAGHEGGRSLYVIHDAISRRIKFLRKLNEHCIADSREAQGCDRSRDDL